MLNSNFLLAYKNGHGRTKKEQVEGEWLEGRKGKRTEIGDRKPEKWRRQVVMSEAVQKMQLEH